MSNYITTIQLPRHTLRPSGEQLGLLFHQLAIRSAELQPGSYRSMEGDGKETKIKVPHRGEIDNIATEIKETYAKGVDIAPIAETTPLIPLYKEMKIEMPPDLRVQSAEQNYDFHLVQLIFNIFLPKNQYPLNAEFIVDVIDDVSQVHRKARPIRLFPDRKDITLFRIDFNGAIGVDAGMSILSSLDGVNLPTLANFNMDAKIKAKILIGPFSFQYRKAALEVKGEGDYNVRWRYNLASQLKGTNQFKSFIILKTSKESKSVRLESQLAVQPYKRKWLIFKDKLPPIQSDKKLQVEIIRG